ncbi:uncharacterized protein LOC113666049 isoform X2 [Pocillopora damicornis]|uniref:uncharacterized protein LOC113666049 isoform X2 n=1 Tax=Pocillopora damicornis TaxID=46731 RepID=UPI000F54DA18|nr:uncharacterized protein LOC113666049 isoform X2 [Pocillopora damicornis]
MIHEKQLDIEFDKVCAPGLHISLGVSKKLFDELENQCFELGKKIQMVLARDSEENDEKIQAFRAAQLHTRQAQQFNEKANYLQELLNLQSLHANVNIMPAYFTLPQEEIDKLLGNAKEEEDNIIKLCSAVVTKTVELCPSFLSQAREISVKFKQVF